MPKKKSGQKRRKYGAGLKEEAVQMLLDGHSAESVACDLGLSGTSLVYRWKAKYLEASAIAGRQPDVNLIHHTDRGGQYAGNGYRRALERARMLQSMSRADN